VRKANPGGTAMVARMVVLISIRASFLGTEIVRESRQRSGGLDGSRRRPYESVLGVVGETNTNTALVDEKIELSSSKGLHPYVPFDASLLDCHEDRPRRRARGREVRQRRPEPRFGSNRDHEEERHGVRIVEKACCGAMKRAGLMVEVKGRVRKVMAGARAADTVIEERMEGTEDML
jgi:hypothetical protein